MVTRSKRKRAAAMLALSIALSAALSLGAGPAFALKPVPVVDDLDSPWALAFLPDGRWLVTERPGKLRIVGADGKAGAPLVGLPAIDAGGQCGLLDVAVDPQFARNGFIYWTFAEPAAGTRRGNSTAVARARLVGDKLEDVKTIFSQKPKISSRNHCGSRIVFDRNGNLWVGLGDRFSERDEAQNLANHLGKVIRIDRDGKAPADNPFVGRAGTAPEIWSLGHRYIQGAAAHPASGELWLSEHGPQGGDEINVAEAGRNYGWPLVTYGRNYGSGTVIGEEGPKPGFEQPLRYWVPSVAPSGLAFVTSDRYAGWKGNLLMGTLREQQLIRLTLDGRRITSEERLLTDFGQRIRDVRQGPDGFVYLVTEGSPGRIWRLEP